MNKNSFYSSKRKTMWNWQYPDWPNFLYNIEDLWLAQSLFEHESGVFVGASQHLSSLDRQNLFIQLLTQDATSTSEIEGQILDRDSIQSTIQRHLGIKSKHRSGTSEFGIAELMVDLYQNAQDSIDEPKLFSWHKMVMNGRRDILIGAYRAHSEPMQIISGPIGRATVHYEAPPSSSIAKEMKSFISWLNKKNIQSLPSIAKAGIPFTEEKVTSCDSSGGYIIFLRGGSFGKQIYPFYFL